MIPVKILNENISGQQEFLQIQMVFTNFANILTSQQ